MRVRQADAPRCWARRADAPPWDRPSRRSEHAYTYACRNAGRDPLGLCTFHQRAIFGTTPRRRQETAA